MITFRPFAALQSMKASSSFHKHDRCLPSGVPASVNILESLRGEPGLQGIEARISALRLSRVNTPHVSTIADLSIKLSAQKSFPAIPALSARVRYTKSSTPFGRSCTMATLDIEAAPFQDDDIVLTKVEMQYSEGTIEDLCSEKVLKLPKKCRPKDHLAFLYRLHHNGDLMLRDNTSSYSKSTIVSIEANVLVSETCQPKIQMKWKSNVDFSAPLNPSFVAPGQTMQRSKRPPSLPVTAGNKGQSDPPQLANAANNVEIGQRRHRAISTGHIGVSVTLTAPRDVYVGEPFTWDVFIVNGSSKPRKLAVLVIPKRSLTDIKSHLAKRSSSSSTSGRRGELELADAVMDENRLYAMQKSVGREEVQIVSLSTEVRLGCASVKHKNVYLSTDSVFQDTESRVLP